MGQQQSGGCCWGGLAALERRCLARAGPAGRLAISGRYHRLPRTLEEDYEPLHQVLGTGLNGEVHLFRSRHTGARVAVKGLKLQGVSRANMQLLEAEVEIFLSMDHPHVARLVDVYESRSRLDLVMEVMEGGMLFDRVVKKRGFSERDAADASWQMLRAINYLHRHGIVHRDIKLENFLFDFPSSNHLKLIDFGFSKMWKSHTSPSRSGGTLFYNAPEALGAGQSSAPGDVWSFGVIAFILLFGYMPFSGTFEYQSTNIKAGKYEVREKQWSCVSLQAQDLVRGCLVVNPDMRLTALQALEHPWLAQRHKLATECQHLSEEIVDALVTFRKNSTFRRACLEMMAWSLTNEERATVREAFLELDVNFSGDVTVADFKKVISKKYDTFDARALEDMFRALNCDETERLHYSEFLAAMVSSRIAVHDDMLKSTFRRFDQRKSGFITVGDLRHVLGNTFHGEDVQALLEEAEHAQQGRISYQEWVEYLQAGDPHATTVPMCRPLEAPPRLEHRDKLRRAEERQAAAAPPPEPFAWDSGPQIKVGSISPAGILLSCGACATALVGADAAGAAETVLRALAALPGA